MPRVLDDVELAQVSISYLIASGGDRQSLLIADGFGDPRYALQFVARTDRKEDPRLLRFVSIYRSQESKGLHQQEVRTLPRTGFGDGRLGSRIRNPWESRSSARWYRAWPESDVRRRRHQRCAAVPKDQPPSPVRPHKIDGCWLPSIIAASIPHSPVRAVAASAGFAFTHFPVSTSLLKMTFKASPCASRVNGGGQVTTLIVGEAVATIDENSGPRLS